MDNIDFLKQILTSGCEYWIAAKKQYTDYHDRKRGPDSIWFIAIPYDLGLNFHQTVDTLLVKDIEKLRSANLQNVCLSESYAPFQYGQSLYEFYTGFPVKENQKEILKKALEIGTNNIYDYKELVEAVTLKEK